MDIRIEEEGPDAFDQYGQVPISFEARSRFRVTLINNGLGGMSLSEETIDPPYTKDYDRDEGGPTGWLDLQTDRSRWVVLSAYNNSERIGGAVVSLHSENIDSRKGLACLWDIRVRPDYRGQGIGKNLFERAEHCARERGCDQLKIETQDINVDACRFYAKQGAELGMIDRFAYRSHGLNEVALIWYKNLR